jgi:hypothetical protein
MGFGVFPILPIVEAKTALPRFGHAQIVHPAQLDGPDGAPAVWTSGKYRFHFQLTRRRYPQEQPDPAAVYARTAELDLDW